MTPNAWQRLRRVQRRLGRALTLDEYDHWCRCMASERRDPLLAREIIKTAGGKLEVRDGELAMLVDLGMLHTVEVFQLPRLTWPA